MGMNESWYKSDCEKCEHFVFASDFIESKECLLSPLEKCPHKGELRYNDYDDDPYYGDAG